MLIWNPLYEVTFGDRDLLFRSECELIQLQRPSRMNSWGILHELNKGVVASEGASSAAEWALITFLLKKALVVVLPDHQVGTPIDRCTGHFLSFTSSPITALRRLREARVCILGLGGVGSIVLQHLVGAGIRRYVLVDKDQVEASNLNRQFVYSNCDVGRMKVDACKSYIASRHDDFEVSTYATSIESVECLASRRLEACQLIVHCLDTPRSLIDDVVYSFGAERKIAVTTAAVGVEFGHWGPIISSNGRISFKEWKAQFRGTREGGLQQNNEPTPWSFGPTNTLISANLARDCIEWLAGSRRVASVDARLVQCFANNKVYRYGVSQECQQEGSPCVA
ncbi:HesA/MoeB/ThiF family protein [Achromobacter aloeverae]|uniref:THIF-type NAD/FAD binding fold domain-containing protein n=1 Tax=Achromobacter aloeverae TaxID=1750518 RepID=A0A4V1MRN7_9BURK|nr:ThiF family adenylyltransferase [Achromobacter aloeverae]RXN85281.1 hypothetical protein C7R54_22585 [Achromobacter aloeverae]